jgi:hypothetical protein
VKVQRRRPTDVLSRQGEQVVLVDGRLVRLSPISAAIWDLTEEPIDVEQLAGELEELFGAPQDRSSLDATKDAVADLVHHGVLRQSV